MKEVLTKSLGALHRLVENRTTGQCQFVHAGSVLQVKKKKTFNEEMWNTTEKFLKQEIMVDKVKSFLTRGTYISLPPLRTRSFAKLSVKYAGGQTICTVFTN